MAQGGSAGARGGELWLPVELVTLGVAWDGLDRDAWTVGRMLMVGRMLQVGRML